MTIANVVTRGFGPSAAIKFVVTRGFTVAFVPPAAVTDSRAAIAWVNLADLGTWTASTAALPVANLQNVHVQRRWRSSATSGDLICDLGSLQSIDTIAVLGLTIVSGTVQVRVSDTDLAVAVGTLYDSGALTVDTNYQSVVALIASPVTGRYVRITITETSGKTYVEAGRGFIGLRSVFTYSFGYGWQKGRVDRSQKTKTRGGQTLVWRDNAYRTIDVTFTWVTPAQRDSIVEAIDIANGASTDVLFVTDPTSANLAKDSIFGLVSDLTPVKQDFFDLYSKQYKIKERL